MKPLIDIRRHEPTGFTYRISALGADGVDGGAAFDTIERCLFDAAASLGHYFPKVDVRFEGGLTGSCAIDTLRRAPQSIVALISRHAERA
jgi:hypothetical protein